MIFMNFIPKSLLYFRNKGTHCFYMLIFDAKLLKFTQDLCLYLYITIAFVFILFDAYYYIESLTIIIF